MFLMFVAMAFYLIVLSVGLGGPVSSWYMCSFLWAPMLVVGFGILGLFSFGNSIGGAAIGVWLCRSLMLCPGFRLCEL